MRKVLMVAAAAAIALVGLSACDSGEEQKAAPEQPAAEGEAPAAAPEEPAQ